MTKCLAGIIALGAVLQARQAPEPPIPDALELKKRAMSSLKESEKNLEKYSCVVHWEADEPNANGSVKRHKSGVREQFFVSGIEIDHALERDGQPLGKSEAKKEQERVDKEVKKYSDPKQVRKVQAEDEKEAELVLRTLRFTNGRRQMRDGRPAVVYDLAGDPAFHPRKLEERFAEALTGRISVDEQSGTPVELQVHTVRDVKIAGGLLANVHKGFQLHLVQQREPDGVWLTKLVEGSGDARAGLFLHPRFRFKQQLDQCHLFSVNTQQKTESPAANSQQDIVRP